MHFVEVKNGSPYLNPGSKNDEYKIARYTCRFYCYLN